ncbi:substrate-binding domain-containing protein [Acidisphaera sp. L21]|uniref:substrate-binding domain-containing protein n=1 Tax=Acidisphaera sp. L21 TaxID=1641851 RepID=UPI00131D0A6F|nr:substrate-binding domain-containing protein [Acidisphaera sp. L21]
MMSDRPTLRIFSTLAVQGALPVLLERSGILGAVEYAPTVATQERLRGGATGDVAILTRAGVDGLTADGILRPGGVDIAGSLVGIAVRPGTPLPTLDTEADLRVALLAARCVCYSRIGASGLFFAALLDRMGIADAVNAKARIIHSGFTAEAVRDGDADMAIQQISELMVVPGITIAGPLPAILQTPTMFTAAMMTGCTEPEAASQLIACLASPDAEPAFAAAGLLPPRG